MSGFSKTSVRQRPAMLGHRSTQTGKLTARTSASKTPVTMQNSRKYRRILQYTPEGGSTVKSIQSNIMILARTMFPPGFLEGDISETAEEIACHLSRILKKALVEVNHYGPILAVIFKLPQDFDSLA